MPKSIAIIGTLDTKGDQIVYLQEVIQDKGHRAMVIDVGVLSDPIGEPTFSRHQVARSAGTTLEDIIEMGSKAMRRNPWGR